MPAQHLSTVERLRALAAEVVGQGSGASWRPLAGAIAVTLGFTLIGFLDDFLIVRRGRNLGLKARQKLLGQFVLAIAFVVTIASNAKRSAQRIEYARQIPKLPTEGDELSSWIEIGFSFLHERNAIVRAVVGVAATEEPVLAGI